MWDVGAEETGEFVNETLPWAISRVHELLAVRKRTDGGSFSLAYPCGEWHETGQGGESRCKALDVSRTCGSPQVQLPQSFFGESVSSVLHPSNGSYTRVTRPADGPGAPDADFVLLVTGMTSSPCGSGTDGECAVACLRDEFDRPAAAWYNFAGFTPGYTFGRRDLQRQRVLHHLLHALGFSSASFAYYRDPDTLEPYVRRAPGTGGSQLHPETQTTVSCDLGISGYPLFVSNTSLLPETMLRYSGERGQPECRNFSQANRHGFAQCTQRIVLPGVRDAARAFSGCADLPGPELAMFPSYCGELTSHWESRTLAQDTMSVALFSDWDETDLSYYSTVSRVTLAMLEASGWYRGNYSALHESPGRDWGSDAGCSLQYDRPFSINSSAQLANLTVEDTVVTESSLRHGEQMFCLVPAAVSEPGPCTFDRRGRGTCPMSTFPGSLYTALVPERARYMDDVVGSFGSRAGGTWFFDYASIIASPVMCADSTGIDTAGQRDMGAYYGPDRDSACFESSLIRPDAPSGTDRSTACYSYSCNITGVFSVLTIEVRNTTGDVAAEVVCYRGESGVEKPAPGFNGTVACLEPQLLCGRGLTSPSPSTTPTATPTPSMTPTPSVTPTSSITPSTTASSTPTSSATPTPTPTPVLPSRSPDPSPGSGPAHALTLEQQAAYCPGTTGALGGGDYPAVGGFSGTMSGLARRLQCESDASGVQLAVSSLLGVDSTRVAVNFQSSVQGTSGTRRA